MKVEIWSDVMCPFCYIGKRRFEAALAQFPQRDKIEVIWKSFQLNPGLKTEPSKNAAQMLAEQKGMSVEQARTMGQQVSAMAAKEGLQFNFDKTATANTFRAHCLAQYAARQGRQDAVEELLFKAYFTDGKNIDDKIVLLEIGAAAGLNEVEVSAALDQPEIRTAVQADIEEAWQIGINGVPFFVFNRAYAISGAQHASDFLAAIEKSFAEWQGSADKVMAAPATGMSCDVDGNCD